MSSIYWFSLQIQSSCNVFASLFVVSNTYCPRGVSQKTKDESLHFDVEARDSKTGDVRKYKFRTKTTAERDRWVDGISAHRDHMLKVLRFQSMNR